MAEVRRLVDPDLGTLELTRANGYRVSNIDLGFPTSRAVVVERVNANGAEDLTVFYGARAVSMTVVVLAGVGVSRRAALDRLRAFASPARRPVLYFNDDDLTSAPDRMVRLRGDQLGSPLTNPILTTTQVQWVAPEGVIESAAQLAVAVPAVASAEAGRLYPRTYPIIYPPNAVYGSVTVVNEGTEPAAPILRLWGPCVDPWAGNLSFGESLGLTGILPSDPPVTLTAEQFVEVDVREATVRLQGKATQNMYSNLTLDSALWWLRPGSNLIRYTPASYGPGARAELFWRHAWI